MKIRITITLLLLSGLCTPHAGAQYASSTTKASFNHLALYVYDLQVSTKFYKDIIGLDTIPEPFHDGKHTWFRISERGHLHIISGNTAKQPHIKDTHLCFTVPSVDVFVQQLDASGIPYESWQGDKQKMTIRVDGVKQIYFQDPDGYWIEINDAKE